MPKFNTYFAFESYIGPWSDMWSTFGAYSSMVCLCHLAIEHANLSRRSGEGLFYRKYLLGLRKDVLNLICCCVLGTRVPARRGARAAIYCLTSGFTDSCSVQLCPDFKASDSACNVVTANPVLENSCLWRCISGPLYDI